MIRRLFYLALGASIAVWVMRKLQSLQPDHVAARAAGRVTTLAGQLRDFADDVRLLSADRESELRAALGLDGVGPAGAGGNDDVKDGR